MPNRTSSRVCLFLLALLTLLLPGLARAGGREDAEVPTRDLLRQWLKEDLTPAPPPPCEKDCYMLSSMSLRGSVGGPMAFEVHGKLLADGPIKVPLFGPANEVRLDDLSLDGAGAAPVLGFADDHYYLLTSARTFTLHGNLTLASDQMLTIVGPLVAFDARLAQGRIVEGAKLSGLAAMTLHFDPMTPESESEAESKTPKVFRLSRSVHIAKDTTFIYRLVMSQATDLGTVRIGLPNGERVQEVSGSRGWTSSGHELLLPTTGKEADITITGALEPSAAKDGVRSFGTDERSAYEWWLVESDPDFRVEMSGEAKLVDNNQSPIQGTLPTARTFLVQRGQHLEVDARSLVRGEVLAAVARVESRFVSVTSTGEVIGDETVSYDNNGLDHLTFTPAGQPMYLSTDGQPGRILHTQQGSPEVLIPLGIGGHRLRMQTLSQTRLWPLAGAISVPMSDYPLTTSVAEVTVGLPASVYPIALFGGDAVRWVFARADWIAALLGIGFACFGFRTKKTRILGSVATVGLWLVSREAFVLAAAVLFLVGAVFLASRFLRGNMLLGASAALFLLSMFGARWALNGDATDAPKRELFVQCPSIPQPESARPEGRPMGSIDTKAGVTPVSLSMPTSERYVQTSRQLVTSKRPFVPRLVYATPTFFMGLEAAWLGVVAMLAFAHKEGLAKLLARVKERLSRRAGPAGGPTPDETFPSLR
jgi:hypothetical protein